MFTIRATPKMSENPTASRAYTPPLISPIIRMSLNIVIVRSDQLWFWRAQRKDALGPSGPRALFARISVFLLFQHMGWQLEGLHAFIREPVPVVRPERHFLSVLPLHREASDVTGTEYRIMPLVEHQAPGGSHLIGFLQHRDKLVRLDGASRFNGGFQTLDRVVAGRGIRWRFAVALLE